jgi:hypothetical protein
MEPDDKDIREALTAGMPADDAFWAAQRARIMSRLGPRRAPWRRWGAVTAAACAFAAAVLLRPSRLPRGPLPPPNMELIQNLELVENLDLLEDLDVLEGAR